MPTTQLGFWGQSFMLQILLTAPVMGIVGYLHIRRGKPLPAKRLRYGRALLVQIVFLLLTMLAAWEQRVPLIAGALPSLSAWLVAVGFLISAALKARRAWPKLSVERLERARIILPDHSSQMRLWAAISAMAGITEECAYRGLAFRFLTDNHGAVPLALTLCIAAFAIAHMPQGWRGVLGTAIIAALMHAVVYLTQSLYLAIVVHAVYDLMIGVIAMPILAKFARTQEQISPAGA